MVEFGFFGAADVAIWASFLCNEARLNFMGPVGMLLVMFCAHCDEICAATGVW